MLLIVELGRLFDLSNQEPRGLKVLRGGLCLVVVLH